MASVHESSYLSSSSFEKLKDEICSDVYNNLVEDAILGLCFEVHRLVKLDLFLHDQRGSEESYEITWKEGCDIFGKKITKCHCRCSICKREVCCSRFAKHFEDCMGLGRQRTAKKYSENQGSDDTEDNNSSTNDCGQSNSNGGKTKKKTRKRAKRNTGSQRKK